jgi:exopolysaccharide production protein ExoY
MEDQLYQDRALGNIVFLRPAKQTSRSTKNAPMKSQPFDDLATRTLDIVISLTAILFLLPLLIVIYALIYISDGANPIFSQRRLGYRYRQFYCHKFRTMRPNSNHLLEEYLLANPAEAENWRLYLKLKRDPRVTFIGRILRKSSLDELPQLFNVLLGEMSLVGPRPIMLNEIDRYGQCLRFYTGVKPGITGLWQVMGRNKLTYRQRIGCDRIFVRKRSLTFYVRILFWTVPTVLLQRGSA